MFTLSNILIGIVAVIFVVNTSAGRQIYRAIRAQLGKLGLMASKADPLANHRQVIQDKQASIGNARSGLAEVEAERLRLIRLEKDYQGEITVLTSRIQQAMSINAMEDAEKFGLQLDSKQRALTNTKKSLQEIEQQFLSFSSKVKTVQEDIQQAKERTEEMAIELSVEKKKASLTGLSSSFDASAGGSLKESENALQAEIDTYRAKTNVGEALEDNTEAKYAELERKQRAQEILAKFKTPQA